MQPNFWQIERFQSSLHRSHLLRTKFDLVHSEIGLEKNLDFPFSEDFGQKPPGPHYQDSTKIQKDAFSGLFQTNIAPSGVYKDVL